MIRGTFGAWVALVLLVLSPTGATAAGSVLDVTVSDPNPAIGQTFTATVGAGSCSTVQLGVNAPAGSVTIDGTEATKLTKNASEGTAQFAVAISRNGEWTISARCVKDGKNTKEDDPYFQGGGGPAVVTVGTPARPIVGGQAASAPGGILPSTGAEALTMLLALAGLLALIVGGTVLLVRHRRAAG